MGKTIEDAIEVLSELGFEMDEDYDNWSSGESVTLKFESDKGQIYLIADDKKGIYDGDNKDETYSKLTISDWSDYIYNKYMRDFKF